MFVYNISNFEKKLIRFLMIIWARYSPNFVGLNWAALINRQVNNQSKFGHVMILWANFACLTLDL